MTETGKSEESGEIPLKGSPTQKEPSSMDVDNVRSPERDGAEGDGASSSALLLVKTPTSTRKADADCFKTPEAVTPTSAKKRKRLTPEEKSLRERERQEKRRKLEEEKQKKENERLEKLKQKEAERLKKEEEKKLLEEERRVERLKKEEERLKKEEEKKKIEEERKQERLKKEEERLKKEEERKRKEDEKKQKEEEKERERLKSEEKKAKQAQFFTKFFRKSSAPIVHTIENGSIRSVEKTSGDSVGADSAAKNSSLFNPLPFQIKTDMAVAPLVRRKLTVEERQNLESLLDESSTCADGQLNYLRSIKKKGKGRKYGRTEIIFKESPEIQVLDEQENNNNSKPIGCLKWRMKLLQFHDNRRPAYWGTWKRRAKKVTAQKPWTREDEVDYEFDSDDEWEDEPDDAEEIGVSGDEAEDQEEGGDGEEDEEGWMVPHGYLSDSEREGKNEDLESLKCKEKEFFNSLKEKAMIGYPFIMTDNLSCYKIRVCPVFRSATVVKKRKPRAPRKKPVENTPTRTPAASKKGTPKAPAPAVITGTKKDTPKTTTPAVVTAIEKDTPKTPVPAITTASKKATPKTPTPAVITSSKKDTSKTPTPTVSTVDNNTPVPVKPLDNERKSQRKRKAVVEKPNPYAKPPSGFLGMELPSDDEEDMDWASALEESDSSDSSEMENDEEFSSSDEDLFIPVTPSKSKKLN